MHLFISYATRDGRADAEALVAALEALGHACWVAPRDVLAGPAYSGQIIAAIEACQGMAVLLTPAANESHDVLQEVDAAHRRRKTIAAVAAAGVQPSPDLDYFLGVRHRIAWTGAASTAAELSRTFGGGARAPARPAAPAAAAASAGRWTVEQVLSGHEDWPRRLAWSPDGARVASAGQDEMVRVWPSGDAGGCDVLEGHGAWVDALAWSPDGGRLASGGYDGTVRLWHAPEMLAGRVLRGHEGHVFALAWSPDGGVLASGGEDGRIRMWSVAGGRSAGETLILRGHHKRVDALAWSPDGAQLASGGGGEGVVRLWRRPGFAAQAIEVDEDIYALAWSPDGQRLAVSGESGHIHVLSLARGGRPDVLRGHCEFVRGLSWSPDGTRLASGGGDAIVRVWPAAGGGEPELLPKQDGLVLDVAWSPNGERLATAAADDLVRLWRRTG